MLVSRLENYTLLKPDVMRPKTASKDIIRHAMYYLLLSFKNASRTIFTMVEDTYPNLKEVLIN